MRVFLPPFVTAVGVIAGMIIGSGVFALPYAVSRSGLGWSLASALIAFFAILWIHGAYGEIAANSSEDHRLPGYVRAHIGAAFGRIETAAQIFAFNAILLVYAILGGKFISAIFGNASNGTLLFFAASAAIFLFGTIRTIGFLNFILSMPLIAATLWISWLALHYGSVPNIINIQGGAPFFSFSVFLFSLAGLSVIADAKGVFAPLETKSLTGFATSENLFDRRRGLRSAITAGTTLPFVLYIFFIVAVLALSGSAVTEEALEGLRQAVGDGVVRVGSFVGLLAVFTSFLALGYDLRKVYELDMRIPSFLSVVLVIATPLLLFIAGLVNFIALMSLVGGFFVALDGIFVVLILRAMRRKGLITHPLVPFPLAVQVALIVLFAASALYEFLFQALSL